MAKMVPMQGESFIFLLMPIQLPIKVDGNRTCTPQATMAKRIPLGRGRCKGAKPLLLPWEPSIASLQPFINSIGIFRGAMDGDSSFGCVFKSFPCRGLLASYDPLLLFLFAEKRKRSKKKKELPAAICLVFLYLKLSEGGLPMAKEHLTVTIHTPFIKLVLC